MTRTITTLICLLVISCSVSAQKLSKKVIKGYDKQIESVAASLNKQLPAMVDSVTRFDSTASLGNLTLAYYYTMVSVDVNAFDNEIFKKIMTKDLEEGVKSRDAMVPFNQIGCTLKYYYVDSNDVPITEITLTPEQYRR